LFDSLPVILRAFNYGVEPFVTKTPADSQWFAAFGPAEAEVMATMLPKDGDYKQQAFYRYLEYYEKHLSEITVFPGIHDLLRDAHEAGVIQAVFTGGGRESTFFCMTKERILTYFDRVITGDDVELHKPHPEGILKVMQDFRLVPEETLVVGDAGADMLAGRSAGAVTVLSRWSGYPLPFDLESESDHVFHSVPEFRNFVFS
jgi:HAD superfamily hydrolase (TIGR01509 family)